MVAASGPLSYRARRSWAGRGRWQELWTVMEQEAFVARLVRGEEAAWRRFVERYGRLIYAVAARLGLDEEDREDVFQNSCVAALHAIGHLRDPNRLASWVYGIARRQAVDVHRRRSPTVQLDQVAETDRSALIQSSPPAAHAQLERLEAVAILYDAMEALEPRCRRLLSAIYLEHPRPSYAEIGRRERMPVGSIGPTRARCLEKVRRVIEAVSNDPL